MRAFKVERVVGKGKRRMVLAGPGRKATALLGRLSEVGPSKEAALDLDKQHVVAVVGKRGSGKTHTLGVVAEGLAAVTSTEPSTISTGSAEHAVVIFDTLNLFQWVDVPLAEAAGANIERQRRLLAAWKLEPRTLQASFFTPPGEYPCHGGVPPLLDSR